MEDNQSNPEQEVSSTSPETIVKETAEEVAQELKNKDGQKYESCLGKYLAKNKVSPKVLDVIYWHDIKCTAGIFGGIMLLLISMYCYPFLTIVTNVGIALLAVAFLYRIGMTIVNAVQKTSPEHPFQKLLDRDIKFKSDRIDSFSKCFAGQLNKSIKCLQDLFLIKDVFQSLKFGLFLWLLSYIASWISPLCILTMSVLFIFTAPKLYEEKYVQIDDAIKSVSIAIGAVVDAMKKKLPLSVLKFLNLSDEEKKKN